MKRRALRNPRDRAGTLSNTALPPPDEGKLPCTETLLRRGLVEGDGPSLASVVQQLRPEMLRLARRYVRSADDAEDLVQDTWIAALVGVDRFEGRSSLKTWLFRILTYRARSAGRRERRLVPMSQLAGSSDIPFDPSVRDPLFVSSAPNPHEVTIGRDLRNRVEAALEELPSRQREVVRLRDLEGWSSNEVRERLRVSHGNQRVLLHRGRLQLRKLVAN